MPKEEKMEALCEIMEKVHLLADLAWPRDASGTSAMTQDGQRAIIDVQIAACKALGLPANLDLMTGDPLIDLL
jgi:hypothetical protein